MAKRLTQVERLQEFEDEAAKFRIPFLKRVNEANSEEEVLAIACGPGPAEGKPGRSVYVNLRFLMDHRKMPGGADFDERRVYGALAKRIGMKLAP